MSDKVLIAVDDLNQWLTTYPIDGDSPTEKEIAEAKSAALNALGGDFYTPSMIHLYVAEEVEEFSVNEEGEEAEDA